jgi:hypothetical protein
MFYLDPRRSFGTTSLLFSRYTLSLIGRVSGEQGGGAAKILSRIRVEHGDSRHIVQMQLMVILLRYVYMLEDG